MNMDPEKWERAKELFQATLDLDPSQRTSFLAENCADGDLRQQVEKLLISYQEAGTFLDDPVLESSIARSRNSAPEIQAEEASRLPTKSVGLLTTATGVGAEDPMIGRHLGDYKIVRRIGQGGMAAVFLGVRADDEYQKEVAIKLVQPGLDTQEQLSRFRNERQTLADLDHPNIVKLLDGGSTNEGLPFLVMDYVEGSRIDDYCDRYKLHIDERLQLFCKVCEAVEYAHEKSIVHRDLKPSNILVTADGVPRLLDFGLAKVLNPQPAAQSLVLTHTGTRCMTPAYASPEQMRGKSITTATDVYSLGVVLYELLTGHRPYRLMQHSPAEIERAICEQEPETPSTAVRRIETEECSDGTPIVKTPELVSETREGQPDKLQHRLRGDLDNIVLKALQKQPERRYGSVKELVLDIERHLQHMPIKARRSTLAYRSSKFIQRHKTEVGTGILGAAGVGTTIVLLVLLIGVKGSSLRELLTTGHGTPAIDSLAVLPVETIHGDQNAELLSNGITDSLINSLSRIPNLKVMSHGSVFHYKGKDVDPQEAGKTLNVKVVLTGRLTQRGNDLFFSTELIDVTDNKHLWGDEYERKSSAILPLQEELAQTIAGKLTAKLSPEQKRELARQPTSDPYAYALYTEGRYYMDKRTVGDFKRAVDLFQQAIGKDPRVAAAYAGLAEALLFIGSGTPGSSEILQQAKTAATTAVDIDDSLAEAHASLGFAMLMITGNVQVARSEWQRAVQLNPNLSLAHFYYGCLLHTERHTLNDAIREMRLAQELDPFSLQPRQVLRNLYWVSGDYGKAIAEAETILKMDPNNVENHLRLSDIYLTMKQYDNAVTELGRSLALFGRKEKAVALERSYREFGYKGWLRERIELVKGDSGIYNAADIAASYALLGNKEQAFFWLNKGYEERNINIFYIGVLPGYDSLRSDPRYADLIRRMGFEQ